MSRLTPHLELLPERQRRLWPRLAGLARAGFVLYGGTAIALRYGHRVSVDFDFFSDRPLDRQRLSRALPWMRTALVLQDQPETLTLLTSADQEQTGVKVSFFGGLTIGRVADPDGTLAGVALLASPLDLLATKLKVLPQRAERKDDQDVATLLAAGLALSDGLAAAQAIYGPGFRSVNASRPWWFSPMVTWPNWAAANGGAWSRLCWPLTRSPAWSASAGSWGQPPAHHRRSG